MPCFPRFLRALILLGLATLLAVLSGEAQAADNPPPPKAQWIWDQADAVESAPSNAPRYFRRTFELSGEMKNAQVWVTCDNVYTLYVNGEKLGGDSEWSTLDSYDVAKLLKPGKNVLAIEAANQGGSAGLIAWFRGRDASKNPTVLHTDASWRASQVKSEKWFALDFDDAKWAQAAPLGPPEMGPWNLTGRSGGATASGDVQVADSKIKTYRPASEEIATFQLPEGFKMELVAAEPQVINPVCLAQDDAGRIYVSESHTYRYGPSGSPVKGPPNPIVRLDPNPEGGYKRTLVADGFEDPVMGMVIRGNQLWATANNYLYRFDLSEAGPATNKQTLVIDKSKAWNPFGMFVLEWGPEGLLYLSVGNHNIDLQGPDGKLSGRGSSGIVCRMQPDGRQMERLVHGLRVPYSFEMDPFGQMWLLSNGEGNPNRFVRVIEGVDYHCYSRGVSNEWLAGRHPLAPPCFELPRGACTQLVRYYGAAYPASYVGSLFLDNWGAHGFAGPNRTIFRYVPDTKGQIAEKQPWLACSDPHFRCSHVLTDHDGQFLIADWYGRDDESDLTGRIWRVTYSGTDKPKVEKPANSIAALGAPHHRLRAKAKEELAAQGDASIAALTEVAAKAKEPLAAAEALWTLVRIGSTPAKAALASGTQHTDGQVRRLAMQLLKRYEVPAAKDVAFALAKDSDPQVRVAAALALGEPASVRLALIAALKAGAADDDHLRYEAAWHLASVADAKTFEMLLADANPEVRRAGLIALDAACYEKTPAHEAALEVLAAKLENPGELDWDQLQLLAGLNADPRLVPALERILASSKVTPEMTAKTILLLRSSFRGAIKGQLGAEATRRFLDAVEKNTVRLSAPSDQVLLLELIGTEKPTPFALAQVQPLLASGQAEVRAAAHQLARRWGADGSILAVALWPRLLAAKSNTKLEERLQMAITLAAIEKEPAREEWTKLLAESDPVLARDLVRSWRIYADKPEMAKVLATQAAALLARDPALGSDLAAVLKQLQLPLPEKVAAPSPAEMEDDTLLKHVLAMQAAEKPENQVALGRRVFERAGCVKCHTTVSENSLRAPTLKGIGAAQKTEYLVESILQPSKVIKTGFETEAIVTAAGKQHSGLVKDEGKTLRVITPDAELTIAKDEIESRSVQKKSLMPDGLKQLITPDELRDLVAYLKSLK